MTIKAHARTLTLWTGSLLSLLIAAAFVASAWCWIVKVRAGSVLAKRSMFRGGETDGKLADV